MKLPFSVFRFHSEITAFRKKSSSIVILISQYFYAFFLSLRFKFLRAFFHRFVCALRVFRCTVQREPRPNCYPGNVSRKCLLRIEVLQRNTFYMTCICTFIEDSTTLITVSSSPVIHSIALMVSPCE